MENRLDTAAQHSDEKEKERTSSRNMEQDRPNNGWKKPEIFGGWHERDKEGG